MRARAALGAQAVSGGKRLTIAALQMWFTFALIAAVIVSYAVERISLELTSIAAVVALLLFFHAFPVVDAEGGNVLGLDRLLSGFASSALAAIMALMVMGQALYQTGAIEAPARWLARHGARTPNLTIAATFLGAAAVSAFMNNTPLVVVLIPAVGALAARLGQSASRLLMPISFATILGGMTTVVGSSTNLLVAGIAADARVVDIGLFDPMLPGVLLAAAGLAYVMLVMPRMLDRVGGGDSGIASPDGRQFIAEIEIEDGHALCGVGARAGLFPGLGNMTVRLVQRGAETLLPPFEDVTLSAGDVVVVAATRPAITEALSGRRPILGHGVAPLRENGDGAAKAHDLVLVEAMIAPASRLIGRQVNLAGLSAETDTIVLAIRRRSRMSRQPVSDIRLEAGDTVLLLVHHDEIGRLNANRDIILLEWSQTELPRMHFSGRSVVILAVTLAAAAFGSCRSRSPRLPAPSP